VTEVMLIDENGQPVGVVPTYRAIATAKERGFDLVEVGATARPPVCKILDFGKFQYEQERSQNKVKGKNHAGEIKEIQFGVKTDEHDFDTRLKHAAKFIEKGYKIRVTVKMIGRENIYSERAIAQINRFKDALDLEFEQFPSRFGTRFSATLIRAKSNKEEIKTNKSNDNA